MGIMDVDENIPTAPSPLRSNSNSTAPNDAPMLDYEVAELTWENGQLSMHGFEPLQVPPKPVNAATITGNRTWDKPRASGTLESIINQGVSGYGCGRGHGGRYGNVFVPYHRRAEAAAASNTLTMDSLVPCSNRREEQSMQQVMESGRVGTCVVGCSARDAAQEDDGFLAGKRAMAAARVPTAPELSSRRVLSVSGSATCHREFGVGFASASMLSPENTTSFGKQRTSTTTNDGHDSVCPSRSQREAGDDRDDKMKRAGKSSISTKRNRAPASHNQSERKRRDKINQKMKALQKLVPNSSKTDKASMLNEVIEYLKQLQAQVQMMNGMKMCSMMLPITMQQQLQMSMMAQMGIGMGMGMDMDKMNILGIPPVLHLTPFMPMASWNASSGDRLQGALAMPMTKDAYSRMTALHQQLHQPSASSSKS